MEQESNPTFVSPALSVGCRLMSAGIGVTWAALRVTLCGSESVLVHPHPHMCAVWVCKDTLMHVHVIHESFGAFAGMRGELWFGQKCL